MSDSPRPPLRSLRSPRGFCILPIHYSHDPACGEEWRQKERQKYQRQEDWDREQEMDFRAVVGALAYPHYRTELHDDKKLQVVPELPLCLCCDFNVDPMIWEIAQIFRGWAHFLDEIALGPATISDMVVEFRNRYPAHPGGISVYGDASGFSRTTQTARSDYDLLRIAMRGYPTPLTMKVPAKNPPVKDRLNATNLRLKGPDGIVWVKIRPDRCPELIQDMAEVVTSNNGRDIHKVWNRADPYHRRTHASDAAGCMIFREWPTIQEVYRETRAQRPRPRVYGRLLGTP